MTRTAYFYHYDLRMWVFLVIEGEDDVVANGSEDSLEWAAVRARKALEKPGDRDITPVVG